jgi:thioredoxin:protein disulfide reductase
LQAQIDFLKVAPPAKIQAKRDSSVEVSLAARLQPGYHVNSDKPLEAYLIPLRLTWESGALETDGIEYPKPVMETYQFSKTPLSVYSGEFEIITKFKVPADAPLGPAMLSGKLRYQACNDTTCFPPKTIPVKVPVEIRN